METTTLIIARHGNTFADGEVLRRVGITDLPLAQSGIEQGQRLATYLLKQGLRPDVIFTSQLQRTKQMAQIFCEFSKKRGAGANIPTFSNSIFNEIDYGIDENQPEEIVAQRLGDALQLWETQAVAPKEWHINIDNIIHNWRVFADETLAARRNKITLVFTSNGIARFAPHLSDISQFKHSLKLATGAFATLTHDSNHWNVQNWNIKP